MLAIYGLGASPEIIVDAYETHDYLLPAVDSPEPITDKNFSEHLGNGRCVPVPQIPCPVIERPPP
jgi:hypothetical protein